MWNNRWIHCFRVISNERFPELYLYEEIPELSKPPSPLEFYRSFISYNRPVIIRGGAKHWPACEKWKDSQYLLEKCQNGKKIVTVAVTPNGYADAIVPDGRFVMPFEEQLTFKDFIDIIQSPDSSTGIYYMQRQNSNLTEEMAELNDDISQLSWATEAFGKNPDATNFWLGDSRAVTSSKTKSLI